MRVQRMTRAILAAGAVLAVTAQVWALPTPVSILQGIGIDPYRDLDPQTPNSADVFFWTEDVVGKRGALGPGTGGQAYDVEGLYSWRSGTTATIVLSTGFPVLPKTLSRAGGRNWQSPDSAIAHARFRNDRRVFAGDIMIDLGNDGTWDYGISMGAYTNAIGRTGLTYGQLYVVDGAGYGGSGWYRPHYTEAGPWIATSEENLAQLDYGAQKITVKQRSGEDMSGTRKPKARYLAAFTVDLSQFPQFNQALTWHWTMECGNDVGDLPIPEGPPPTPTPKIPEPATLLLLGLGGAALGLRRRRLRRRA